ncbi:unnamed protein product [Urochloa humidicola]
MHCNFELKMKTIQLKKKILAPVATIPTWTGWLREARQGRGRPARGEARGAGGGDLARGLAAGVILSSPASSCNHPDLLKKVLILHQEFQIDDTPQGIQLLSASILLSHGTHKNVFPHIKANPIRKSVNKSVDKEL